MARFDPDWLNRMYNNRALVPEHEQYFQRWAEQSAAVRGQAGTALDLAYGSGPRETLDVFPAATTAGAPKAPVLVFIHGGYWRALDKSVHSFVAPPFTRAGACVVLPNYALCPAVTLPQIVLQMVQSLAWVYRNIGRYGGDPARITVAGHSAGGHLAAMMLACHWPALGRDLPAGLVRNALGISGLYELDSIRHAPFLQETLKLTAAQVKKASPAWLPAPSAGPFYTVAGGAESAEFLRQNRLIQQAWGERKVPRCEALEGLHHFSVVDALVDPGHSLHRMATALLQQA